MSTDCANCEELKALQKSLIETEEKLRLAEMTIYEKNETIWLLRDK